MSGPGPRPSARRSYALVVLAACLWGTIGTAYRLFQSVAEADALTVVTLRAGGAAALLWGWLALTDRPALRVAPGDLPRFAAFGLTAFSLMYLALFAAFDLTSVAVGTVLLYLAPALVAAGAALFLGEPLTRRSLAALAVAFAGCLLVVGVHHPGQPAGSALGIGAGVVAAAGYASYSLFAKPLLRRYRPITVLAHALLPGAAGLLVAKLATAPAAWPGAGGVLAVAAYGGLVATIAPFGLYTLALRGLPAAEASVAATLEPVVAMALAAGLLGERLDAGQLLGAAGVVGGVALLAAAGGPATAGGGTVSSLVATARRRGRYFAVRGRAAS